MSTPTETEHAPTTTPGVTAAPIVTNHTTVLRSFRKVSVQVSVLQGLGRGPFLFLVTHLHHLQ